MRYIPASIGTLALVAVAIAAGCSNDQGDATAKETGDSKGAVEQPRFETVVIPDGSLVTVSLDTRLSTDSSHTGDAFVTTTVEPIRVGGKTVVAVGSKIHGVLRDVEASGRVQGRARMTLAYETLVDPGGKTHTISAVPLTLQAASETSSDVEKIAAGTVLGALIGGVTGGEKGAAIGAGAGAGAGTILMLATKGDELELEVGQKLSVHMTSATSVQVLAQK